MAAPTASGRRQGSDPARVGVLLGFLVSAALWLLAVLFPRFFLSLELQAQRLMLQRRGEEPRSPEEPRVVLVTRDDHSYQWVERHRGEPPGEWSREIYAELLGHLREMGARAVGFDFLFDSRKKGTEAFQEALAARPDSVLAVMWQDQITQTGGERSFTQQYVRPLPELEAASRVGAIRVPADQDEMVRRYFLQVTPRENLTLTSFGVTLARLAHPDRVPGPEALDLDDQGAFALELRAPSPAFDEVEIYRLLDPERRFELRWQTLVPLQEGDDLPLRPVPTSAGNEVLEVHVDPPGVPVEVLAVPLAGGSWSRAEGSGRVRLEGLAPGPCAVHVARSLGPDSWGIFSAPRVDPVTETLEVAFPPLAEPLALEVPGPLPGGATVLLTGQGGPLGRGTYQEVLRAHRADGDSFRTPRASEEGYFVSLAGQEAGVLLRGDPPPRFEAPGSQIPPASRELGLEEVPEGARALVVAGHLPLPPYQATHPVEGGSLQVGGAGQDRRILLEYPDGTRRQAARPRPSPFQDAVVLVGPTGGLDQDFVLTPWDHHSNLFGARSRTLRTRTPGVEIHAHAVRTLLTGRALRTPTGVERMGSPHLLSRFFAQLPLLLGMLLLGGSTGWALSRAITRWSWLLLLVTLVAYEEAVFHLFQSAGTWIHMVLPLLAVGLTWVAVLWYSYATVERRRREIRAAFQHYLDPDIVRELEENPDALSLGGKHQQITCFFSDIESFSSFSEVMTPPELVSFINEYLTAMSDLLLKYGGWIDKFIGDAIVAVFNAPRDQPDHAFRCVLAALEMKQREAELRQEWSERGLPQVRTRIGINTGSVIVGNVGTQTKKDYTILGDAVNLAARLEALNKSYGTYLMIGEATYAEVQGRFDARELDLVRVKGKKVPAAVYQVVALRGEASQAFREARASWEQALEAYREQDFEVAEAAFREVLAHLPEDGPCLMYLERIETLRKHPPPEDWDGVWTMEHK